MTAGTLFKVTQLIDVLDVRRYTPGLIPIHLVVSLLPMPISKLLLDILSCYYNQY